MFKLRVKRDKTCGSRHTSNIEISHGYVKTRKTSITSLHVCRRFADAIKCLCLSINLHLIGNSVQQDACLSRLPRALLYTSTQEHTDEPRRSKTRAKDDDSRSVTFQYVITRHVPRYLPLQPSRIGAASFFFFATTIRISTMHVLHVTETEETQELRIALYFVFLLSFLYNLKN